jgi:glycosyltransferase involved in cell wall biosynthesis
MKVLFVSSGNNNLNCPIAINQAKSIKEFNPSIEILHFRIIGKGLFGYLKNLKDLKKKINEFNPNIIHSHYSFSGYLSALTGTKTPIVASLMGSDVELTGLWKLILNIFSKKWKSIIVKSDIMKSKCGIQRSIVIPNGVNIETFEAITKEEAKQKLKLDSNKQYILFLADPNREEKNFKLAQTAFDLLNNDNTELLVAYNVPFENTKLYYYASDVVLMTSKHEGSPNVIKEAMACNKPIVCTNVGDVELLLSNLNGCFVTEHNATEIANCLKKALAFNKETNGIARLKELKIDANSIAKKIIDLYYSTSGIIKVNDDQALTICAKGIWDSTIPGISFNAKGISNYCLLQEKMMQDYPRGEEGKKTWESLVQKIKRSGK